MKYEIVVAHLNNDTYRWQVLEANTLRQVATGAHQYPGQARHDGMEARRKLPDNPPLEQAVYDLYGLEDVVTCALTDVVEEAEDKVKAEGGRFDDFAEQDDGEMLGILYWENVCPELDSARTMIQDAYALITDFLEQGDQDGN